MSRQYKQSMKSCLYFTLCIRAATSPITYPYMYIYAPLVFPAAPYILQNQEFCMVMSLIDALKRGQPLPELSTASTLKKSVKRSDLRPSVTSRVVESSRETEVVSPRSPKRQSRVASLVGNEQHRQATPGTNTSEGERDTALQHEGQERVKSTVSKH